jgi:two-component system sensor histidine kinase UhpB
MHNEAISGAEQDLPPAAPIRVLLVEDDMVDRMACQRAFDADPDCTFILIEADTGQDGLLIAEQQRPDCILLDYQLPDLTGLEFLERLNRGSASAVPVMMLTGADNAAVAAEAIRRGALDYLVKDSDRRYLELLPVAIHRMLREQRLIDEKRQIEAKFRVLVEQIQAITYSASVGSESVMRYISPQIRLLGFTPAEWLAAPGIHAQQMHPDDRAAALAAIDASRLHGTALLHEYRMYTRDGTLMWFRDQAEAVKVDGSESVIQGIWVDITSLKAAEADLRQTRDAMRELAAYQENIREDERKRIAREVHDELGGLLSGIRAYISVSVERAVAAGAEPDPLLVDAAALAKDAIESVRKVITDLRPSVLDQLGVWAALEWYTGQIAHRTKLECSCVIAPALAAQELDADRSTMLFRIVQEALTNVVRHADARNVEVHADCRDGLLCVRVVDDGKGIDDSDLVNGESWGVLGMIERARHFGGELTVSGAAGHGTTLFLQLPWGNADAGQ